MNNNTRLVEEYGALNKLCSEIYGGMAGVTAYINDMEEQYCDALKRIPRWDYDCRRLKDLRNKRNRLSHGEIPFDTDCADADDVEYIIKFKERIYRRADPVAEYRKYINSRLSKRPSPVPVSTPRPQKSAQRKPFVCAAIVAGVLFLITLAVMLLLTYSGVLS